MVRRSLIILIAFAVGAALSLAASIAIAGVISRGNFGMAVTGGLFAAALLALSWAILRQQGVGLTALGLPVTWQRVRQLAFGFLVGVAVFLGIAVTQSIAVGARWKFEGKA